ncbi:hypothetical protein HIM_01063 [Hirsutella minnesotensis 3608]|nr:hypothetical protein HIM_01063 [Hirsutella minnesotensis 3608]
MAFGFLILNLGLTGLAWIGGVTANTVDFPRTWLLADTYDASNFFSKFDFVTGHTGDAGYSVFQSEADAFNKGLIGFMDGDVYIGPDSDVTLVDPCRADGSPGRDSVRIESKARFTHGLLIARFTHTPQMQCGLWPAIWTYGDQWPKNGEIDLLEGANTNSWNEPTFHASSQTGDGRCRLDGTRQTGFLSRNNCINEQSDEKGCSVVDVNGLAEPNAGSVLTGADSGLLPYHRYQDAMEWTSDFIKIFRWRSDQAPANVDDSSPDTSIWGPPTAYLKHDHCDIDRHFSNQRLVLGIDFCGNAAGQPDVWNSNCGPQVGERTCAEFVAKNPQAFRNSYFKIKDIRFFEEAAAPPQPLLPLPSERETYLINAQSLYEGSVQAQPPQVQPLYEESPFDEELKFHGAPPPVGQSKVVVPQIVNSAAAPFGAAASSGPAYSEEYIQYELPPAPAEFTQYEFLPPSRPARLQPTLPPITMGILTMPQRATSAATPFETAASPGLAFSEELIQDELPPPSPEFTQYEFLPPPLAASRPPRPPVTMSIATMPQRATSAAPFFGTAASTGPAYFEEGIQYKFTPPSEEFTQYEFPPPARPLATPSRSAPPPALPPPPSFFDSEDAAFADEDSVNTFPIEAPPPSLPPKQTTVMSSAPVYYSGWQGHESVYRGSPGENFRAGLPPVERPSYYDAFDDDMPSPTSSEVYPGIVGESLDENPYADPNDPQTWVETWSTYQRQSPSTSVYALPTKSTSWRTFAHRPAFVDDSWHHDPAIPHATGFLSDGGPFDSEDPYFRGHDQSMIYRQRPTATVRQPATVIVPEPGLVQTRKDGFQSNDVFRPGNNYPKTSLPFPTPRYDFTTRKVGPSSSPTRSFRPQVSYSNSDAYFHTAVNGNPEDDRRPQGLGFLPSRARQTTAHVVLSSSYFPVEYASPTLVPLSTPRFDSATRKAGLPPLPTRLLYPQVSYTYSDFPQASYSSYYPEVSFSNSDYPQQVSFSNSDYPQVSYTYSDFPQASYSSNYPEVSFSNSDFPQASYSDSEFPQVSYSSYYPQASFSNLDYPQVSYTYSDFPQASYTYSDFPQASYSSYYPEVTYSSYYPEVSFSNSDFPQASYSDSEFPQVSYSSYYPQASFSNLDYPQVSYTYSDFPQASYSSYYPEVSFSNSDYPEVSFSNSDFPQASYSDPEFPQASYSSYYPEVSYASSDLPQASYSDSEFPQVSYSSYYPQASFSNSDFPQASYSSYYPEVTYSSYYPEVSFSDLDFPQASSSNLDYPQASYSSYYPEVTYSSYYPEASYSSYYPQVSYSSYYPQVSYSTYYPEASYSSYYPEVTYSSYYPEASYSSYYPQVTYSSYYPEASYSSYYPQVSYSSYYPQVSYSSYYPEDSYSSYYPQVSYSNSDAYFHTAVNGNRGDERRPQRLGAFPSVTRHATTHVVLSSSDFPVEHTLPTLVPDFGSEDTEHLYNDYRLGSTS